MGKMLLCGQPSCTVKRPKAKAVSNFGGRSVTTCSLSMTVGAGCTSRPSALQSWRRVPRGWALESKPTGRCHRMPVEGWVVPPQEALRLSKRAPRCLGKVGLVASLRLQPIAALTGQWWKQSSPPRGGWLSRNGDEIPPTDDRRNRVTVRSSVSKMVGYPPRLKREFVVVQNAFPIYVLDGWSSPMCSGEAVHDVGCAWLISCTKCRLRLGAIVCSIEASGGDR